MPDLAVGGIQDCQLWLVYNAQNLHVTGVKVLNPSTQCRVHVISPSGQVFDQQVPIAVAATTFNVPNNYMTLQTDPSDGSLFLPAGWQITFTT